MLIFFIILVLIFNLYLLYYSKKKNYLLVVWRTVAFVVTVSFLFVYYFYVTRFESNLLNSGDNYCIHLVLDKQDIANPKILDEMLSTAKLIEAGMEDINFSKIYSKRKNLLPLNQSIESNIIQKCSIDTISKYLHIDNRIVIRYDDISSNIFVELFESGSKEFSIVSDKKSITAKKVLEEIFSKDDVENNFKDKNFSSSSNNSSDDNNNDNELLSQKKYLIDILMRSNEQLIFNPKDRYNFYEINLFFNIIRSDKEILYKKNKLKKIFTYIIDNKLNGDINSNDLNIFKYQLLSAEIALFIDNYDYAYKIISEKVQKEFKEDNNFKNLDPRILYILSKLSENRIKTYGFKFKKDILDLAVNNINVNTELIHNLGYDYLYNFDRLTINKAEELFTILYKLYPKNVNYIVELAFARRLMNKMESSLSLMSKAIELDPMNWYYLYSYGTQLYVKDKIKAKNIFLEAIEMGDSLNSNLYLGKIYYDEGDFEEALFYYRERVRHSYDENDEFKLEAMKGIRRSLKMLEEESSELKTKEKTKLN